MPNLGINIPIMGMKKSNSNALFSNAQQQVLKLLYIKPGSTFNINEIIRLSHSGSGAIQRELEKLTEQELIIVERVGNQKRYQANQQLSYFPELRSIIIKTFGLTDVLRETLQNLNKHIKIAFIFGSVAKGTDTQQSDVDLILIGEDLIYADFFQGLMDVEKTIGRKINPMCYSALEWTHKYRQDNHFIKKTLSQSKIFVIGTEDELAKIR